MRITDLNKKSLFESYLNEVLQYDDNFIDELKTMFGEIYDKFVNTNASKNDVADYIKSKLDVILKKQFPTKIIDTVIDIKRSNSSVKTFNNSHFELTLNFSPTYITQMTTNISQVNISKSMFIWNCIDITAHEMGHIEQNIKNQNNKFDFNDPKSVRVLRAEIAPYAKQISLIIKNVLDSNGLTGIETNLLFHLLDTIPQYDDFITDLSFIKNDKIKKHFENEFKKHITNYLKGYL